MAVVSSVPRMNGSNPYWLRLGFHTLWKIHENPNEEKTGRDWSTIDTRYHATRATKIAAAAASRTR
jgi:hypothetical protein